MSKIFIVGLNFHPELVGIGRYTGEMAQYLAEQGHEVRVVTTPPYYPHWKIKAGYRAWRYQKETWQGVEIQEHTITKKFKSYPTPFSSRKGAATAFDLLFKHFKDSVLIVSYSSNSQPTLDEMVSIMSKHKQHVEVVPVDYKYSFGNQSHKVGDNKNDVQEYLFVGF